MTQDLGGGGDCNPLMMIVPSLSMVMGDERAYSLRRGRPSTAACFTPAVNAGLLPLLVADRGPHLLNHLW
jgi:hypothetical protein